MKGIYIITGTSRGIGKSVAERLLDTGNRVVGISRSPSPLADASGYRHVQGSVTDADWIEPLFGEVKGWLGQGGYDLLCLFHNAAVVKPLHAIETCDADAIRQHVEVNLTAPIQLTARFMAYFADQDLRKKVAFMTSGAAETALPDMALYCTSKAGLSMFAACLGREQDGQAHGYESAAINPGMVETGMQKTARGMDAHDFRPLDMFRGARDKGIVQDPEAAARRICELLEARTEMGKTVSVQGGSE